MLKIVVWAAAMLVTGVPGAAASARSAATSSRYCDASRPAVAFDSTGRVVARPQAVLPCGWGQTTGFGATETRIVVAPDGEVFVAPAIPPGGSAAGISQSRASAGSWTLVKPRGNLYSVGDTVLYVDRLTGRLFYDTGVTDPAETVLSSQASRAGSPVHWSATTAGSGAENPRLTSAPPPRRYPRTPARDIVYICTNGTPAGQGGRTCYRSADGGLSFKMAGVLFGPSPPSECGGNAVYYGSGDGSYPEGAPDGSLYVLVPCGGKTLLAKSTDEGSTWPIVKHKDGGAVVIPSSGPPPGVWTPASVPTPANVSTACFPEAALRLNFPGCFTGPAGELRVDSAGNLYNVQLTGSSLLLRISRDGGLDWSGPLNMTAPAARYGGPFLPTAVPPSGIYEWWMAVGYKPGQVAVAYMSGRSSGGYDGFITLTHDALDRNPVFYAQAINPPSQPITSSTTPGGDDFIGVDVGPDGSAWAAFYSDCLQDSSGKYTDPSCQQDAATSQGPGGQAPGNEAHATTVGRLLWPARLKPKTRPRSKAKPKPPRSRGCDDPVDHDGDRDPRAPRNTKNLCTSPDRDSGKH